MSGNAEPIDAEVEEPEIEPGPEAGGLVAIESKRDVEDQLFIAENIGRLIEAQNKLRFALLGLAQPGDWIVFGTAEKAKAEIGFGGAMRIGSTLGVSFTNWTGKKETGTDEKGEWYRWEFECDAIYRHRRIRVYGRAGSRDKFFGKAHGVFRALSEVDEGNIKMAGRRAAMKEGVKVIFGLHHMDPEDLKRRGVKLDSAGGYEFKSQDEKAEETTAATITVKDVTSKTGKTADKSWTKFFIYGADGEMYQTFEEGDAKFAKEAKVAGQKIQVSFKVTKFGKEITGIGFANGDQTK